MGRLAVTYYTKLKYPHWPPTLSVEKTHKKGPKGLKKCFKIENANVKRRKYWKFENLFHSTDKISKLNG